MMTKIRQRIKNYKLILCCIFHVKGYHWCAPWVREEMLREEETEDDR